MKSFALVLLALGADAVSPMQKVFTMLSDLQDKVEKDGVAAVKAYENYTKFCTRGKRDLGYDIQDGEKTVEELTAAIAKASSDIDVSATKLEELAATVTKNEADLKAAQEMRTKEKAEHVTAKGELTEAMDMLGRAIKTLSEKLAGSSLLQQQVEEKTGSLLEALGAVVDAAAFTTDEKHSLMAFVESATRQAPEVAAYEPKSGGILSVLEDMKSKARDNLNTLVSEDKKAQHSFAMLQQSLQMQIAADTKEMEQTKAVKAEASESKATAEGDLTGSEKDLANDKASLQKLEASCSQATADFEESKASRAEELEALKKAEEVLAEKTGNAQASVYKAMFLQVNEHSQTRSNSSQPDIRSFEVVKMVRTLAKKSQSSGLETLASNIESLLQTRQSEDVFAKVKELIQNMIDSRKEEAAADQTKKAYCDEEKAKTKDKVDDLTSTKEKLSAKVDKKSSESETLKSEAATLQRELAELAQLQIEMDETRKEESTAFKKQKEDLEAGLEGVRSALTVLRDYYASGTALLQQPDLGFAKSSSASTGILGMLEVVESDFGRSLAQAETAEATKAEDYESMTKQNKLTKVQKDQDQKYKTKAAAALDQAVGDLSSDGESTKEELSAVLTYQESLAKQCYDGGLSYEEKAAKRQEEIDGLKEALVSLGGTDLTAVLLQNKGLRGSVKH